MGRVIVSGLGEGAGQQRYLINLVEDISARKRAVSAAMKEVAGYLGNTPAVARASYVDPRVIDLYDDGVTIRFHVGPSWRRIVSTIFRSYCPSRSNS